MTRYCSLAGDELRLKGHWTITAVSEIKRELPETRLASCMKVVVAGEALEDFDTSAAWCLNDLILRLQATGIMIRMTGFKDKHQRIYDRVAGLPHEKEAMTKPSDPLAGIVIAAGRQISELRHDCYQGIGFLGALFHPRRLRFRSIVFHVNEVGIKAVPIIALMAFSIAFVMGYQGAFQLQKFDATIYTVDLVVLSTLREMGVLITAIMVAGRSGSAFAAQIGIMKLNEEVDALRTMGVSPFEVLVLPRILAILIALPLLTVVADMMGLFGGYIFSSSYLGYSYVQFLSRMQEAADMQQFYIGLFKAPVFAVLIGIVGCMQGLKAEGSAEDIGRKTITAVVQSIFLVVVADAIFSVIFTRLGI